MRLIIDQNGTKWTVTINGPRFSLGAGELSSKHISVMNLSFESSDGKVKMKRTAESPLEIISDSELLELLNRDDESYES